MVIECKKSGQIAWVFYSEEKEEVELDDVEGLADYDQFSLLSAPKEIRPRFSIAGARKVLTQSHQLPHRYSTRAISGHAFHPDGPDRGDSLYKASMQVTKGLEAEFASEIEHLDEETKCFLRRFRLRKGLHDWIFWRFYPVVVYDGRMFEATPHGNDIELNDTKYVQLNWETRNTIHLVDIVSLDYFESFLELLDQELHDLKEGVERVL